MFRFVKFVVLGVVAFLLLLFAFANRHVVTVSFDPFGSSGDDAFAITAPLFAVVIVFAMLGVVVGAFATWVSQGRHRRAARGQRDEVDKWRAEAESLRAAQRSSAPTLPPN
jgi:uncharacterized integral membrane protein